MKALRRLLGLEPRVGDLPTAMPYVPEATEQRRERAANAAALWATIRQPCRCECHDSDRHCDTCCQDLLCDDCLHYGMEG